MARQLHALPDFVWTVRRAACGGTMHVKRSLSRRSQTESGELRFEPCDLFGQIEPVAAQLPQSLNLALQLFNGLGVHRRRIARF
jgi:hypothetical protein